MLPHSRYPLVAALRRFSSAPPLGNAAFFPPLPEQHVEHEPSGPSQRTTGGRKAGGGFGTWATVGFLGAAAWALSSREPKSIPSLLKEQVHPDSTATARKTRHDSILPSSSLVDGPRRRV
ncbi:hypothetical protein JCM3775_004887 [Rhodotorula graminis]